jgi:hypothetical protein
VWGEVKAGDPVAHERQLDQAARLTANTRKQPNALISLTIGVLRQNLGRAPLDIDHYDLDRRPDVTGRPATRRVAQHITGSALR